MTSKHSLVKKTPYETSLFIGRQELIEKIREWLEHGTQRVLSLVGPPGIGKSWVMRKAAEVFQDDSDYLVVGCEHNYVFELSQHQQNIASQIDTFFSEFLSKSSKPHELLELTTLYYSIWKLPAPLDRRIELLAEVVSEQARRKRVIWFIDNLDAVDDDIFNVIARYLAVWIGGGSCTYAIVAHRDDQSFGYPISWSQTVLEVPPFKEDESREQISTRLERDENLRSEDLRRWFASCASEYNWDHPGLNDLIIKKYQDKPTCGVLLRELLKDVIYPAQLTNDMFEVLCKMAAFDGWTRMDLIAETGRNIGDPAVQQLFSHRLFYMDEDTRKYKVAPGIKEVARAACNPGGEMS